jgi:methionyl aminopeptidase
MASKKIRLKSPADIEQLKISGKILSGILQTLSEMLKPGIKGDLLDKKAEELAQKSGATCSFKGFEHYPAHICLSKNHEIVHGFPYGKIIEAGDVVGLDIGIKYKGFFTDAAITKVVSTDDQRKKRLATTAFQCLKSTLKYCRPGYRMGDIGNAVETLAESRGYSVVKKLVGHGVGFSVHEAPLVPNYGKAGEGIRLKPGMVLAIEPMLNEGTDDVVIDKNDGWTFFTADNTLSAHFEWTVAITTGEPIILTPLDWVPF